MKYTLILITIFWFSITNAQKQNFETLFVDYKNQDLAFDNPRVKQYLEKDAQLYYGICTEKLKGKAINNELDILYKEYGSYFIENINEDVSKLGIGDLNRIASDGRVKVKVVLDSDVDFLKSKTADIEDWTGSGELFLGGGNQYYNPIAKTKIM